MARRNAREYLFKDQVRLKKYFYVLRPLLALSFIGKFNRPPPVEFENLLKAVTPDKIIPGVERLLEIKRNSPELGLGDPIAEINSFIESELERHGSSFSGQGRPDLLTQQEYKDTLNSYFRVAISEKT